MAQIGQRARNGQLTRTERTTEMFTFKTLIFLETSRLTLPQALDIVAGVRSL